jgi:uncharacterized membrane protein
MKLSKVWSTYEEYTRQLTQHARKLGFAGVAVCWLLRAGEFDFPLAVLVALFLIVLFFVLDVCQYGSGALIHYRLAVQREEEVEVSSSTELAEVRVEKEKGFDSLPRYIFIAKLVALSLAYGILLIEIASRV